MLIAFDLLNIYYLPQYSPIIERLKARGHRVQIIGYANKNDTHTYGDILKQLDVELLWVKDDKEAASLYQTNKPDWVFFGNKFNYLDEVHLYSKTAQLGHGIGPKPSYYHKSCTPMTVRFIEGSLRLEKINQLYPNDNFVQVGFSKLDPIINGQEPGLDLIKLGLDPTKPTLLYAPTFNPSSLECFPDNWPADFAEFNLLIKAHSITLTREQYAKQREKLARWTTFDNVYVAGDHDLSLLPFMHNADLLISEASSTLFEFAALDKPVIVCNFFKLKWNYRGIFRYRFYKRFGKDNVLYNNIGAHINAYSELQQCVKQQLAEPQQYHKQRQQYTQDHVGPTDGKASDRIVDYLESH
ncbi:CDP-glycerol glycerophosphotransferase family protein [Shewanella sp. Isolate11]|uniref:CDP-glycerol glycerophosphotransferase family protein n=1 Tax=Shewanella sp. Isolate11 TaxID=2908530 RepID=UPI001EFDD52D|nr:CDP-glycerol glycerophosphotransferase family protein [Shewanella sp. Isolate11]MCG9697975.1 CDP-glycerol glycerophosphotransferase family protein [Shewanella sp. Isolate11]